MNEVFAWFLLGTMWVILVVDTIIVWRLTQVVWDQHKARQAPEGP